MELPSARVDVHIGHRLPLATQAGPETAPRLDDPAGPRLIPQPRPDGTDAFRSGARALVQGLREATSALIGALRLDDAGRARVRALHREFESGLRAMLREGLSSGSPDASKLQEASEQDVDAFLQSLHELLASESAQPQLAASTPEGPHPSHANNPPVHEHRPRGHGYGALAHEHRSHGRAPDTGPGGSAAERLREAMGRLDRAFADALGRFFEVLRQSPAPPSGVDAALQGLGQPPTSDEGLLDITA